MNRSEGLLINGGRSSRVYRFIDKEGVCYLKRYTYDKIHWRYCWQKSQARKEYENLEKIKRAELGCGTIEILAYGEKRECRILRSAFILSREVAGSQRLSLFLNENQSPQRKPVVDTIISFGVKLIHSGLALNDLYFRNILVIPENAAIYLLDLQHCAHNRKRARLKTYPQLWSDILLYFTPDEQAWAAARLAAELPYNLKELRRRAEKFLPREKKRKAAELAYAKKLNDL
ncbi:MAG: hypothetical protein JXR89_03860 [Deltaproteobacteria bacterium]|nr:hypothetical protein [Deltaproteobacteria bacterium]